MIKEIIMDAKKTTIKVDSGMGILWFIGWLFTIAFANLIWWKALLGLLIWPYYLGIVLR